MLEEEVIGYMPEVPSYDTDHNAYVYQVEEYVAQPLQEQALPTESTYLAEEDIGDIWGC